MSVARDGRRSTKHINAGVLLSITSASAVPPTNPCVCTHKSGAPSSASADLRARTTGPSLAPPAPPAPVASAVPPAPPLPAGAPQSECTWRKDSPSSGSSACGPSERSRRRGFDTARTWAFARSDLRWRARTAEVDAPSRAAVFLAAFAGAANPEGAEAV